MDTAAIQAAAAVAQSANNSYRSSSAKGISAEDSDFLSTVSELSSLGNQEEEGEVSFDLLSILGAMMQGNLQTSYADILSAQTSDYSALLDSDAISGNALLAMLQAQQDGNSDAAALIQSLLGTEPDSTLYNSILEQYISSAADTSAQPKIADAFAWTDSALSNISTGEMTEAGVQIPVVSVEHSQDNETASLFAQSFAEGQFARTIRESKDTLAQDTAVQEELAALMQQSGVQQTENAPVTPIVQESAGTEEAASVYEQTLTALTRNLETGSETFKVRLNPEGLGEITVEMTKSTDGFISINLVASSSRTAQMLSEQVGALQTAIGQKAEISGVSVEDPNTDMFYQQYSEQHYQQNFQSGSNNNENYHQHRSHWDYPAEEQNEQTAGNAPVTGVLNTYI